MEANGELGSVGFVVEVLLAVVVASDCAVVPAGGLACASLRNFAMRSFLFMVLCRNISMECGSSSPYQ